MTVKMLAWAALALVACAPSVAIAESRLRPFTEADAIGMTTIGDPDYWHHNQSAGRVAHFSPDGRRLVVVLRRGDLSEGSTEYSLLLYRTEDLLRQPPPAPDVVLRMSSLSNREVFASIRWLPDNDTLVFLGENPGEERQVFGFGLADRTLRQLTRSATSVTSYSASADGKRILYTAEKPRRPLWDARTRRDGIVVSEEDLTELITGEQVPFGSGDMYLQSGGAADAPRRIELVEQPDAGFAPVLSPDGRHVLVRAFAQSIPRQWRAYTDPLLKYGMPDDASAPAGSSRVMQYFVVDVATGGARPLLDAPQVMTSGGVDARWAADGESVLMTLVHLPLDGVGAEEWERRAAGPYVAEIALNGQVRPLAPASVFELSRIERWQDSERAVVLVRETLQGMQRSFFRRQGDGWTRADASPDLQRRVAVELKEGLNLPPAIVVRDSGSGRESMLLDLNPQFGELALARQEEVEWQASDGTKVRGGLYYPPDYVRGKRYPLVIQTHGYSARLFAAEGIFTSAFAAQALAAKDIVVLQAWDFPEEGNEAAWQRYAGTKLASVALHQFEQSVYEGAIDHLDTAGLIDRDKVGIIGFSYTCWSVKYALSHPRPGYRYAAAAVSDGFDGGYWNYIAYGNQPALARQFENTAGGTPYGPGLQAWLREAPGFNVDRVETPLRMIPLGNPGSLLNDWEWFVLLRRMQKPVELVMVEDGSHSLVKPWDRMVASGGNVDWFDFWLNGRKDPAADKAAQYARWEAMRP